MAHKKAAGGGVRQHKNPTGKRLGVKVKKLGMNNSHWEWKLNNYAEGVEDKEDVYV